MTPSSYTGELFLFRALGGVRLKMSRKRPLGDWLGAGIAQYEVLATATRWLAAKPELKTMKRDDYKGECIDRFGISGRDYQFLVWPVARELAGLTRSAKPGPKKQIKK